MAIFEKCSPFTLNTNESGQQLQRPPLFCCGQAFFFRSLGAVAL